MDEMYTEIRDQLRKCHDKNTQDVYLRNKNPVYQYHYNQNRDVQGNPNQRTSWAFSLTFKTLLFLGCVFTFSCYIYGGQDLEKGANRAFNELKAQIRVLEDKDPNIKEAMVYVRKAYHEVYQLADTYFMEQKNDTK